MKQAWRRRLREYVLLTRLDKPIGILLLLWPVLWALWIAADGWPPLWTLAVFLVGTVLTRSAGCIVNDFADRDIDPHVERTRDRPLAARRVSPYEALALFVVLMLVSLALVFSLGWKVTSYAVIAAFLLLTYPLFKRFFPAPQLYLGIAFGWGVPMSFVAVQGEVPPIGWWIFGVTVLWALIYDTYYAMVDRKDDLRIGVRSTAVWFGKADLAIISALQLLMIAGLWKIGNIAELGLSYFLAVIVAAAIFHRNLWWARHRERAQCFRAFLGNHHAGLAVFVGVVLATAQR
ncbi:MAG: 4-hydroxybenzoate octaprenyltransferase [Pseudomonadota bacterium]